MKESNIETHCKVCGIPLNGDSTCKPSAQNCNRIMTYFTRSLMLLFVTSLMSCGAYTHSAHRPKIKSVLAITEAGDTIAVPVREFERNKYDSYTRFRYNDNWYWNNWRYDFNWRWNQAFYAYPNIFWWDGDMHNTNFSNGYRASVRPKDKPKPRRVTPRVPNRPKTEPKSYMQGPRGGRSYNNRNSNPNTTRNVQPQRPTQSRTNIGRTNTGRSRSNQ